MTSIQRVRSWNTLLQQAQERLVRQEAAGCRFIAAELACEGQRLRFGIFPSFASHGTREACLSATADVDLPNPQKRSELGVLAESSRPGEVPQSFAKRACLGLWLSMCFSPRMAPRWLGRGRRALHWLRTTSRNAAWPFAQKRKDMERGAVMRCGVVEPRFELLATAGRSAHHRNCEALRPPTPEAKSQPKRSCLQAARPQQC